VGRAGATTKPGPTSTTIQGAGRSEALPKVVTLGPVPTGHHRSSSGSPLPFAIGGALVLVLAASGATLAWRRHRSAGP
jgi:hypothetical protein